MDRLDAFETMLADLKKQVEYEEMEMERLKSAGKVDVQKEVKTFMSKKQWRKIIFGVGLVAGI